MKTLPIELTGAMPVVGTRHDAEVYKASLLAEAADIGDITDEFTAGIAAEVVTKITKQLREVESARTQIKAPILEAGRTIDRVAADYCKELEAEKSRIGAARNKFAAAQLAAAQEAERKRQAEIARIEAEKRRAEQAAREAEEKQRREQEAAARAKADAEAAFTAAERKAAYLAERAAQEAAQVAARQAEEARMAQEAAAVQTVAPVAPAPKARIVWKWELQDIHALYAHSPSLVAMEAKKADINQLVAGGHRRIPGLRIYSTVEAVR